jgi:hypothetical protein
MSYGTEHRQFILPQAGCRGRHPLQADFDNTASRESPPNSEFRIPNSIKVLRGLALTISRVHTVKHTEMRKTAHDKHTVKHTEDIFPESLDT